MWFSSSLKIVERKNGPKPILFICLYSELVIKANEPFYKTLLQE